MKFKYITKKSSTGVSSMIIKSGKIMSVNAAFLALTEYEEQDFLMKEVSYVCRDLLRNMMLMGVLGSFYNQDTYLFTKSLQYREVRILQERGEKQGEIVIKIHEKLNSRIESKALLADRLIDDDIIGVGIYKLPEMILIKANQAYLNSFNEYFNKKERAYGCCLKDIFLDFEGNDTEAVYEHMLKNNETICLNELKVRCQVRYFDNIIMPITEKGMAKYAVSMLTNVTERVLNKNCIMTQAYESSIHKKQMEAIFDNISDAIYIADKDGHYIFQNSIAKNFFQDFGMNHIAESFVTVKYYDKDDKEIMLEHTPVIRGLKGEQVRAEYVKIVHDNNIKYVNVSSMPIFDEKNAVKYIILSGHEITETVRSASIIKTQQEQFEKINIEKKVALKKSAEKMKLISKLEALNSLKDKLFTIVTHDIRHPFATISTLTELLEDDKEYYSNDNKEIIDDLKLQIRNTFFMVENLLEWSRNQMNGIVCRPTYLKLSETVREVVRIFDYKVAVKGITVYIDIDEALTALVDKNILEIVLRNLLSNALKFTYAGGFVSIQASKADDKVIIAISDTGVGISAERVYAFLDDKNIQSTLGTEGEKGIGMGHIICKELIRRNGGDIWVVSIPGKGSTFYFSLCAQTQVSVINTLDA